MTGDPTRDTEATPHDFESLPVDEYAAEAAAAAIPDAGDDTLRDHLADQIAATWHELACGSPPSCGQRNCEAGGSMPRAQALNLADALLPRIREYIAAADSPQRLFGRLISTAKGREILDANGIHGVGQAEAAIERVRTLHRPCRIFDECDHEHELAGSGGLPDGVVEVEEVGLTCEDGFLYRICYECCTGGSNFQSEECVDHHTHSPNDVYCSTIRVLDNELEVPVDA